MVILRGVKTDIVARVEVKEDTRPVHLPEHCHRHDLLFEMLYHCENLLVAGERSVVFSLGEKKEIATQLKSTHSTKWVQACLGNA